MATNQDSKYGAGYDGAPELPHHSVLTQGGVNKVESANAVWGRTSKAFLFFGVALIAYIYSLDGTTTYLYQALATSSFQDHASLSTIAVAQAIILALSKPISAKISDVFGRAEAFLVAVLFYVVGFIIVASSSNIGTYGAGAVIYYIGYASVQILLQIIIADLTTLRWRTLVAQAVSLPFFINAFVSGNIAQGIISNSGWRWGYGMFCIIIPAGAAPIMATLFWAQFKAKRLGVSATDYYGHSSQVLPKQHMSVVKRATAIFTEMDTIGLLLLGFGFALVLIPLTVVNNASSRWNSPSIIAMIVMGFVILVAAFFYEGWVSKMPVIPPRFMRNRTVLAACIINFFDFVSFYLQFTYQYSFIYVTKSWALKDQGYFAYTQTLSLTLFAVLAGFYVLYFKRAKWLLVVGLCVRLLGVGLMIHSKGAHGSTAELVIVQIIQGAGGGIGAACTLTLAQASMPHQDVGAVTAAVLLFAEIGGAVGTAIAGAIWRNTMPGQLAEKLAGLLEPADITAIYQSITTAATYPLGSPIREGVIDAYTHVMLLELIPATVLAVIPIIASLFMLNLYLGETQNAVEDVGDANGTPLPPDMAIKKV